MKVAQSCLTVCDPVDYTVHGILQARILEWVAFPFSRGSSQSRDRAKVSLIAGGFFTSWATGKPKNTEMGSLALLQEIFPTQESNRGLLHCRWILYQLSYQKSSIYLNIHRKTCTQMCIAALLIIAKTWMQPRHPSVGEWLNKLWYNQTMEYYSAIKRNVLLSHKKT